MAVFSLQIMREMFAEALARPLREVRFPVPDFGETSAFLRRGEPGFFLDDAGAATVLPAESAGRAIPRSISVTLAGNSITLARFGEFTGEEACEPEVWYRTREGAGAVIEELFRSLCVLAAGSRAAGLLLRAICELIAERLENEIEQQLSGEEQLWFRLREQISRGFQEELSRNALAEKLRIHPVKLSRLVRKFTGTGVCEYVQDLRLGCAEELLQTRGMISIEEISRRCGFHSASYFISLFRRKYGISPGAFRRRHLENS